MTKGFVLPAEWTVTRPRAAEELDAAGLPDNRMAAVRTATRERITIKRLVGLRTAFIVNPPTNFCDRHYSAGQDTKRLGALLAPTAMGAASYRALPEREQVSCERRIPAFNLEPGKLPAAR